MPFQLLACGKLTKQASSQQLTYSLPIVHEHVTVHEGNKNVIAGYAVIITILKEF